MQIDIKGKILEKGFRALNPLTIAPLSKTKLYSKILCIKKTNFEYFANFQTINFEPLTNNLKNVRIILISKYY